MADQTKTIYKLLRTHARAAGYSTKGRCAWKSGGTLARIVCIQACQWSDGLYFNSGLILLSANDALPCSEAKWHYCGRIETRGTPYFETFRVCGYDAEQVDLDEMSEAIEWLLAYLDEQWCDEAAVARMALDYSSWMQQCGGVTGTLLAWARTRVGGG